MQMQGDVGADTKSGLDEDDRFGVAGDLEAIELAASVVQRRWKVSLIWLLGRGGRRYSELARLLCGATPKMLTQQLRDLEREGLVVRSARVGGARHVVYALSEIGEELSPSVELFARWARRRWARRYEDQVQAPHRGDAGPGRQRGGGEQRVTDLSRNSGIGGVAHRAADRRRGISGGRGG